jgi:putative NADPH-quinone reductase
VRVSVIFCHPVESSPNAALHQKTVVELKGAGHELDDCDLHARGFKPVIWREARLGYHDVPVNRLPGQNNAGCLMRAKSLVFCFPACCFDIPAKLKSHVDRPLMHSMAIDLSDPHNAMPPSLKPFKTHVDAAMAHIV